MSILWDVGNYAKIKEIGLPVITSGTQNMGNGVYWLKAGTPLSNAGAVANTSSAKYLVAEDFYFYSNTPTQPKLVKVIEQGYVDIAKAEAAAGIAFSSDAKSALATAGIILVDGALQTGGGGGGNVLIVHGTIDTSGGGEGQSFPMTIDKTLEEIAAAEYSVLVVPAGDGTYLELPEVMRTQNEGMLVYVSWGVHYGAMEFAAVFDGEEGAILMEGSLPSVSSSDNGKILQVYGGVWDAVTDKLILHGTLTSAMGGTITETPLDLVDAITENKRIIFAVTMPTASGTADYNVECTVTKVENSKPYAYGTCSTDASVLLAVYIGEVNDSLIFEAGQYTLTPYSP